MKKKSTFDEHGNETSCRYTDGWGWDKNENP